jgi:hypothetical protein
VISAMAISKGYLRGRPLPLLGVSAAAAGLSGSGVASTGDYIDGSGSCGSCGSCGSYRYGFTTVDRKVVGPLGSLIIQVSPSIVSRSNSPSQWPLWPVFPSL